MGVFTYESVNASVVAPARLFKALILDSDNLIPKAAPQAVKSIETISGIGGPGSIKKVHLGDGSQFKYVVHQIDAVDTENLTYSYSAIEGDVIGDVLEKISYEVKIGAGSDGGSIMTHNSKYFTKGDHEIDEELVKGAKERASGLFKAVETYLVANPDAYN